MKTQLLDFYATWCGPCKMLSMVLDQVEADGAEVDIKRIDIEEHPDLAEQYGVMAVPTLVVIKGEEEVARHSGFLPKPKVLELISK